MSLRLFLCLLLYVCDINLTVVLYNVTDTAGMSGRAVSGQAGCAVLWTGSQFSCVVSRPRSPFRGLKGGSSRFSCCLAASQVSQTKQRIAVWKCKNRVFQLYFIVVVFMHDLLHEKAWITSCMIYQECVENTQLVMHRSWIKYALCEYILEK